MTEKSKRLRTTRRDFMAGILAGGMGIGHPVRIFAADEKKTARHPEVVEHFSIQAEDGPNPWTHLNFNNKKSDFQFAILGDQTGSKYDMTLEGHFQQHEVLRPFPYAVETDMPAQSRKVVPLQISSQTEVAVKGLKPLHFKRTVYCRPDSRPKIPYKDTLEIKIEVTL